MGECVPPHAYGGLSTICETWFVFHHEFWGLDLDYQA